jgi:CheY-like chemotaxis protein
LIVTRADGITPYPREFAMPIESSPGESSGRPGIILVVDDEEDILDLVTQALAALGRRVVPARNGDIALVILESGVAVDLLFTDVVMPGNLDGIALAEQAKRLNPSAKILYGTGHTGLRSGDQAPLLGDVLSKPYRLSELVRRVQALLAANGQPMGCA